MESQNSPVDGLIASFEAEAPAIVPRDHLSRYGWPWAKGYMANLACMRQGPPCFRAGARAVYRREDLAAYLRERLTPAGGRAA